MLIWPFSWVLNSLQVIKMSNRFWKKIINIYRFRNYSVNGCSHQLNLMVWKVLLIALMFYLDTYTEEKSDLFNFIWWLFSFPSIVWGTLRKSCIHLFFLHESVCLCSMAWVSLALWCRRDWWDHFRDIYLFLELETFYCCTAEGRLHTCYVPLQLVY